MRRRATPNGFTLIELLIVVAIIAILIALAYPQYQNYVIRANISEALLEISKVRTDLAVFYALQGRFPISGEEREEFRIFPADGHPAIRNLRVQGVGACNENAGCTRSRIEVQLRRPVYLGIGGDAHSQLRLDGQAGPAGVIAWTCGPRDVQPVKMQWLPASCRTPPS